MTSDSVHKLIQDLDIKYSNRTPLTELTPFEYGVLAGQRILIEDLKLRYKFGEIETIEKDK